VSVAVKICGINDAAAMNAAVQAGADYVGLVFFPKSPRFVTPQQAEALAALVPATITTVGLFVDPTDEQLIDTLKQVPLRMLQLHGGETSERVAAIKKLTGLPVMKAIGVSKAEDVAQANQYQNIADMLLFDAKPPATSELPGGNAKSFDWSLLKGHSFNKPWMLAGGLNAQNLAEAMRITGASIIDVSSGVEDSPGHKSIHKIQDLIAIAHKL
jgi:phosphoribosylanthranilate isomerase